MRSFTQASITDTVLERFAECHDPRLQRLMAALIRHLHEFAREVQLTEAEWHSCIEFLTGVGQKCDDKRQEFILLSDTLGLSAVVDLIANHGNEEAATESSLLGPFYRKGAPELPADADIAGETPGERIIVLGRVNSTDRRPIPGAVLDVWQASPNGLYDLQDESQPEMNLRGRFRTDAEGRFRFRSIKTASYPVPTDGPVGQMLRAVGRHPFRPAHVHFIVSAPQYETLTTALYIAGDKYLDSDAVFGSRKSLVVGYRPYQGNGAASGKIDALEFDFVLTPEPLAKMPGLMREAGHERSDYSSAAARRRPTSSTS